MTTIITLPKTPTRTETMRVVKDGEFYLVQVYSEIVNNWITMAEHTDMEKAIEDCAGWYMGFVIRYCHETSRIKTYASYGQGRPIITSFSYSEFYALHFANEHLASAGCYHRKVSKDQWRKAYLLCDGLGKIDENLADKLQWEWGHVSQSSIDGLVRAAMYLANEVWKEDFQKIVVEAFLFAKDKVDKGEDPRMFILVVPGNNGMFDIVTT